MEHASLAQLATGRDRSLFAEDLALRSDALGAALGGRRVLVIGGAGSIGSATIREILPFAPAALHVVDHNENELAELVRSIRSAPVDTTVPDLRTLPLDYGSVAFAAFVRAEAPYDFVLNFAAIKHVRSEKDSFSVLQMLDTNIRKQARLLDLLRQTGFAGRYFSVSTDKAANPTSMMGATKRVMEHVMFDRETTEGLGCTITSARFANVAFSNGSLPQSFLRRLAQRQPLAAPEATRRYFVSMEEAGHLCLLAAVTAPHDHIVIPRLDPREALVELQSVAERFLAAHDLAPAIYRDETAARRAVEAEAAEGRWPLLLTELTTAGEKPYEEFVGRGETEIDLGYRALAGVSYLPLPQGRSMRAVLDRIEEVFRAAETRPPGKDELKAIIALAEPGFLETHRDAALSLDERV